MRIPEDVKVVSVSNVGNGPVLCNGVARVGFDPFGHGDYIGDTVLRSSPMPLNVELKYVILQVLYQKV